MRYEMQHCYKVDHSNDFIIGGQYLLRLESVKYAGGLDFNI